jgi:hypothetical protein
MWVPVFSVDHNNSATMSSMICLDFPCAYRGRSAKLKAAVHLGREFNMSSGRLPRAVNTH